MNELACIEKNNAINEGIMLFDRIFTCECGYSEDRDIKAAKTLLLAGEHIMSCIRAEYMNTPEKRKRAEAPSSNHQRRME